MRNARGLSILALALLSACASVVPAGDSRFEVFVLGRAQDGGLPHVGCERACCVTARRTGRVEYPACLGVHDRETGKLLLIEATPAVEAQIALLHELSGQKDRGRKPVDAVMITHAHIGHYLGLAHFGREVASTKGLPLWVSARMGDFLTEHGPWSQLVALGQIEIATVMPGAPFAPFDGLEVEAIAVPHRDEFSDTMAYKVRGPNRTVLFVPDVDRWGSHDGLLERLVDGVDVAYLDGSFWDGSGLGIRDLSEIRHPMMLDTMERLADAARADPGRLRFIHLNHSNPAFSDPALAAQVDRRGFRIARQGERVGL